MSERTVRPMKMIVSILGRGQGNAFVRLLTGKHIFSITSASVWAPPRLI